MSLTRAWRLLVGGLLVAVGSFMPWKIVTTSSGFRLSTTGIVEGSGRYTLLFGLVLIFIGVAMARRNGGSGQVALGLGWAVAFGLAAFWVLLLVDIRAGVDYGESETLTGRVGYGMYVVMAGLVVSIAGLFGSMESRSDKAVGRPSSPRP